MAISALSAALHKTQIATNWWRDCGSKKQFTLSDAAATMLSSKYFINSVHVVGSFFSSFQTRNQETIILAAYKSLLLSVSSPASFLQLLHSLYSPKRFRQCRYELRLLLLPKGTKCIFMWEIGFPKNALREVRCVGTRSSLANMTTALLLSSKLLLRSIMCCASSPKKIVFQRMW